MRWKTSEGPVRGWQALEFPVSRRGGRSRSRRGDRRDEARCLREGTDARALSRRLREVASPVDEDTRSQRLRGQLAAAARLVRDLCAEPEAGLSDDLKARARAFMQELERAVGG